MATRKADNNGGDDKPKRVVGPRPVFILLETNEDGSVKLDARGRPVIGKVPDGYTHSGKGRALKAGDDAVVRQSDAALEMCDIDPSLTYLRVMVQ